MNIRYELSKKSIISYALYRMKSASEKVVLEIKITNEIKDYMLFNVLRDFN